jgi:hypothetical protein
MLEQVENGGKIVAELIEKGAATLQLFSTKPQQKQKCLQHCYGDLRCASFKRRHPAVLLHCTNQQPSLPLIEKVNYFF